MVDEQSGYKNGGYTECMQEWWMNRVDTRMVDTRSVFQEWWMNRVDTRVVDTRIEDTRVVDIWLYIRVMDT